MFTDKVDLKDFEKQDPEYQDLLRRVLAIQADCEIGGPNLYVKHILPSAPTTVTCVFGLIEPRVMRPTPITPT